MCRDEVKAYSYVIKLVNCGHIFSMDSNDFERNYEPEKVVVEKKNRNIHVVTSAERSFTVIVVACMNAEDTYLPLFCIMKRVKHKDEFRCITAGRKEEKINKKSKSLHIFNLDFFMN